MFAKKRGFVNFDSDGVMTQVSRKLIQEKALDLANKKGLIDFKASLGWIEKFMDRNGFTIRKKTSQKVTDLSAYGFFLV